MDTSYVLFFLLIFLSSDNSSSFLTWPFAFVVETGASVRTEQPTVARRLRLGVAIAPFFGRRNLGVGSRECGHRGIGELAGGKSYRQTVVNQYFVWCRQFPHIYFSSCLTLLLNFLFLEFFTTLLAGWITLAPMRRVLKARFLDSKIKAFNFLRIYKAGSTVVQFQNAPVHYSWPFLRGELTSKLESKIKSFSGRLQENYLKICCGGTEGRTNEC